MKILLTTIFALMLAVTARAQDTTACAKLYSVKRVNAHFWMLNMGGYYPNQQFTIILNGYRRGTDLYRLKDSTVCVTGSRKVYRGKVQIIARQLSGH
jgi:hypothetical protein